MKTNFSTLLRRAALLLTLTFAAGMTTTVTAQSGAKGGAAKLLELSGRAPVPIVQPADQKPMTCPLCKEKLSQRVDKSARGAIKPSVIVATRLCQSCGTDWTVKGHGKAKVSVPTHKCASCGA